MPVRSPTCSPPLTAAGPEGDPLAFGINLRYLVPAFALGLALVPLEPRLTPERARLPLLIGGIAALLLALLYSDSASGTSPSRRSHGRR